MKRKVEKVTIKWEKKGRKKKKERKKEREIVQKRLMLVS